MEALVQSQQPKYMSVSREIITYSAQRVSLASSKPFGKVLNDLEQELNTEKAGNSVLKLLATAKTKQELEDGVAALTEGKRDLFYFTMGSHSRWMRVYYGDQFRQGPSVVYTLGNPMIAKDMIVLDPEAGFYIPPRIMVAEVEGGGTKIVYDLPSSIIGLGGQKSRELIDTAKGLDEKLEALVTRVLQEVLPNAAL